MLRLCFKKLSIPMPWMPWTETWQCQDLKKQKDILKKPGWSMCVWFSMFRIYTFYMPVYYVSFLGHWQATKVQRNAQECKGMQKVHFTVLLKFQSWAPQAARRGIARCSRHRPTCGADSGNLTRSDCQTLIWKPPFQNSNSFVSLILNTVYTC